MYIQRLFEKKGGGALTTWIILKEQNLVCYLEFLTKTRLEKKSLEWNLNSGGYLFGSVNCTVTIYESLHLNP